MVRTKVGLMIPSMNTTFEPDFYKVAPPDITIHTHRLWSPPRPTQEDKEGPDRLKRMNSDVETAVKYLQTAPVDILVYGCTSGSFSWGLGGEERMAKQIEQISGVPAVVTSGSVVEALRATNARRISVATPYPDATNQRLRTFFESAGFEILNVDGDPQASVGSHAITAEEPEEILRFAASVCSPDADVLLCSCTAWRCLEVIDSLENKLGIPVITSNQATIWATLVKLGIQREIRGFGRLLEGLCLETPEGTLRK